MTGSTVTKYYFAGAGAQRVAMRSGSTLSYLLSDHLGSTSLTTDANGALVSEMRYCEASRRDKPWGEVRSWWTASLNTTPVYKLPDYTFTGQFSYMDDLSTTSVTEGFGLMFYNARWYDPALGRFAQADSIIPDGIQGLDRYAYTNNNPIRYTDPSGHAAAIDGDGAWNPLDSAVVIATGRPGETPGATFPFELLNQGSGVVVGDRLTIRTAEHVWGNRNENSTTLYVLVDGEWIPYDLAEIVVELGPGDLATITLPDALPDSIIPATEAENYHSAPGQKVVSIYHEPIKEIINGEELVTGYSLHALITTLRSKEAHRDGQFGNADGTNYGKQLVAVNPQGVLNRGDSGGGVFSNGDVMGVNSATQSSLVMVSPLCFQWYWAPLSTFASPC